MYRTIRLCSDRGGYESVPESRRSLDLSDVRRRFEAAGIRVLDARVLLIASFEAEVTVAGSGRLLIKTRDPIVAERTFDRVRSLLDRESDELARSNGPSRPVPPGDDRHAEGRSGGP